MQTGDGVVEVVFALQLPLLVHSCEEMLLCAAEKETEMGRISRTSDDRLSSSVSLVAQKGSSGIWCS